MRKTSTLGCGLDGLVGWTVSHLPLASSGRSKESENAAESREGKSRELDVRCGHGTA